MIRSSSETPLTLIMGVPLVNCNAELAAGCREIDGVVASFVFEAVMALAAVKVTR